MFEELSQVFTTNNDIKTLPLTLDTEILQHLTALEDKFDHYSLDLHGDELDLVTYQFRLPTEKFPDEYQDEFLELKEDSSEKDLFDKIS